MTIKVRITGKTQYWRRSEYYEPDTEVIVELDVDSIDDVDQSLLAEYTDDIDWQESDGKDCLDEEEIFFEEIDSDEDDEDDHDDNDE